MASNIHTNKRLSKMIHINKQILQGYITLIIMDSAKRRRLLSLINRGNFEFCLIQETKRDLVDSLFISNLWGRGDFGWVAKAFEGFFGGILSI